MAQLAVLVHEVVTGELGAARLARVVLHVHVEGARWRPRHRRGRSGGRQAVRLVAQLGRERVEVPTRVFLVAVVALEGLVAVEARVLRRGRGAGRGAARGAALRLPAHARPPQLSRTWHMKETS